MDWNNGLRQRIAPDPLHPAGVLTVNCNGNGVAEAFHQPEPFFASEDVNVLHPGSSWTPPLHSSSAPLFAKNTGSAIEGSGLSIA